MKNLPLWQISVTTCPEAEEIVSALLEEIFPGPPSVYSDAEKKMSVTSVYCSNSREWISPRLKVFLQRLADMAVRAPVRVKKLRRENWAHSWKKHFRPLEIGGALLIKPSWSKRKPRGSRRQEAHSRKKSQSLLTSAATGKKQAVVILDPGLSFGTGQHPTTEFCLRQIVAQRKHKTAQSFLDIGTGSGILAIAAAKLGYAPVEAFDFDGEAVRIARANARKNRVDKRISLSQQDLTKLGRRARCKFDLICANLISNLLIEQREKILSRLKPGGVLVLAGILKKEFAQIQRACEQASLKLVSSRVEKEWRSGAFRFRDSR